MVNFNNKKCNGITKCAADGICISVCGLNSIKEVNDMPVIDDSCVDCGLCVMNCPNEAITLERN